jgi:hypothetical protein
MPKDRFLCCQFLTQGLSIPVSHPADASSFSTTTSRPEILKSAKGPLTRRSHRNPASGAIPKLRPEGAGDESFAANKFDQERALLTR